MTGSNFPLAAQLDAIPIVQNPTDRAARFPSPNVNQRVFTVSTLTYDRWDGVEWTTDFVAPGSENPQTFNGFLTAGAGLGVAAPGTDAGFPDFLTLNSLRTFGGAVGEAYLGLSPNGANDTRWYNDGTGQQILTSAGIPILSVDSFGNITMLGGPSTVFYGQIGGHQQIDGWSVTNPAASLSNALLARTVPAFVSAGPGYLTGLAVRTSANVTGGNAVVTVFKNAVATALTTTIAPGASFATTSFQAPTPISALVSFAAGDALDVRLTTAAGWTFTTGTLTSTMEIIT